MKSAVFAVAAGVAAALAAPALAQPLSRAELEAALAQRDQQIAALEKRVAALEGQHDAPSRPADAAIETVPTAATASS